MAPPSLRSSLTWALVLVPLLAYLGPRLRILSFGFYNVPGRMPLHANFTSHEIKFENDIRNCEDVVLLRDRPVALLVCDPGRETWNTVMGDFPKGVDVDPNGGFYAYNYQLSDDKALTRFDLIGFTGELRTVGFEFHEPTATLLVTNLLRQGSPRIEQFRLDFTAGTATHLWTISHPLIHAPNSIATLDGNNFFVTNQHLFPARWSRFLWMLETYLAPPVATVVHVRILNSGEVDAVVAARQAYPNGVTFMQDESRLAVSSSSKGLVYIYKVIAGSDPSVHPRLQLEQTIPNLPFLPDNLSTARDGALLISGHPNLPKLNAFARSRRLCHRPEALSKATEEERQICQSAEGGSWVSEWTPEAGLFHVYSGWEYPTSATAVRDRERGFGIVAGLYARGILVWKD